MKGAITALIYKIVSHNTLKIYIGHTTGTLEARLSGHANKTNGCASAEIIACGDYEILLICAYVCNTRDEANKEEQRHIDLNIRRCVNKQRSYRGYDEPAGGLPIHHWLKHNREYVAHKYYWEKTKHGHKCLSLITPLFDDIDPPIYNKQDIIKRDKMMATQNTNNIIKQREIYNAYKATNPINGRNKYYAKQKEKIRKQRADRVKMEKQEQDKKDARNKRCRELRAIRIQKQRDERIKMEKQTDT